MEKDELLKTRDELKTIIDSFEKDPDDYSEWFDEVLDETKVVIMGVTYSGSQIVKNCSIIDYNTHLSYFVDSKDLKDDENYNDLVTNLEEIEERLKELEEELEEMEV